MDQDALVAERVEAGKRFLSQLSAVGFPVAVAFWARPSDEQWFLYLASPVVDEKGGHEAYRDLTLHERRLGYVGIDPFEVRLVSPSDTMATAAAKLIEPRPDAGLFGVVSPKPFPGMTRFGGSRLGGIDVDGVLVYPPLTSPVPGA